MTIRKDDIKMNFYKSPVCGKIAMVLTGGQGELICCGEPMVELKANSTDAATEKHVPAVTVEGNRISVVIGSVVHPMTDAHSIQWIALETKKGFQMAHLKPEDQPTALFLLDESDTAVAVYEYCNLHGLWVKEL